MLRVKCFFPLGIVLALGATFKASFAQDLADAIQAWQGGPVSQPVAVMKDGVRCEYSQTALAGHTPDQLVVGFSAPKCRPSGASFEFPIYGTRISKQGRVCVFECAGGQPCLRADIGRSPRATLYEARPGSCEALAAAARGLANRPRGPDVAQSTAPPPGGGEVRLLDTRWNFDLCYSTHSLQQVFAKVQIADWHELKDQSALERLLVALRAEGLGQCPNAWSVEITIEQRGIQWHVLKAGWYQRTTKRWGIDSRLRFLEQEEAAREEQKKREAAERKRKEQLAEDLKAALADCGPSPRITGGPWFTSTYKQAALDDARNLTLNASQIQQEMNRLTAAPDPDPVRQLLNFRDDTANNLGTMGKRFVCVKEVGYIGPAVNPFGGNAARALFIGYSTRSKDYEPVSYTHDFPY